MKVRVLCSLFVMLIFWSGATRADNDLASPVVTSQYLGDVLKATYLNSPVLRAAREELKGIEEAYAQARSGWHPEVSSSLSLNRADVDGGNLSGAGGSTEKGVGLNVTQPLFRGGRTSAAIDAAMQKIQAQRYALLQVEQEVLLDVASAYMDVIQNRALVDLSLNNKDVISQQLAATRQRFEVGELTRTDVAQAEARLSRVDADLITAEGALKSSVSNYQRITGDVPAAELLLTPMMLPLPVDKEAATRLADDIAPALLQAKFQYGESEKKVDEVFGELLPEVNLSLGWGRTYDPQPGSVPDTTTQTAGITARIPLYQSGAVRSRVRAAKYESNQSYIDIITAQRRARDDVMQAWEALESARAEIAARETQVDAARIAREGVYKEEQLGIRSVLETLDANQELLDAETSLVTAQRNEVVAQFALSAVLGLLTPENLGFPDVAFDYEAHFNRARQKVFSISADSLGDE